MWFFLKETDFVRYEDAASQIFEHIIAVLPEFDIRIFQSPSGDDLLQAEFVKNRN